MARRASTAHKDFPLDAARCMYSQCIGALFAAEARLPTRASGLAIHRLVMRPHLPCSFRLGVVVVMLATLGCGADRTGGAANGEVSPGGVPAIDVHRADSTVRSAMADPRQWPDYG